MPLKNVKILASTSEEHAGGTPGHARHECSAGLKKTLKLCGFPVDFHFVLPLVHLYTAKY
jgi:hypothetical protein